MAQPLAQPNYQRLTDAFSAASEECSRLPNIPAINNSQTLVDLIGQLRNEMRQSATQTTERFDSLQADTTIIRTDIGAIHARLDASEGNAVARLFNSTINNPQTPFQSLRNRHNMPVQGFPENGEVLANLSRTELTTILRRHDIPAYGGVADKRKWLAQYMGVVVQVV